MFCSNNSRSAYTFLRHCEKRSCRAIDVNLAEVLSRENERRSNLPLQIDWREFFIIYTKITSLQSQSKEIASRMKLIFASSVSLSPLCRLAMTNEKGGA
jgi:hypothetical protein